MDALTHTLVALHLARRVPGLPLAARFPLCLGASLAPDLDRHLLLPLRDLLLPLGPAGVFHSLPGAALLALAIGGIARPLVAREDRRAAAMVAFVAVAIHLLLDSLTSIGLPLFWPLDDSRYALAWIASPDLWVWMLLGIPLLRDLLNLRRARGKLHLAPPPVNLVPLLVLYLGICGATKVRAIQATIRSLPASLGIEEVQAYPLGPIPFTWSTVARTADHDWHRSRFSLVGGHGPVGTLPSGAADPRMRIALETAEGKAFLSEARAPFLAHATAVDPSGAFEVALGDLRFADPASGRLPWVLWLRVGPGFSTEAWEIVSAPLPAPGVASGSHPEEVGTAADPPLFSFGFSDLLR